MGSAEQRQEMIEALQARTVPQLRELGFKGSFPHFRRVLPERTDLLTFQFDRYGGGFVVETAKAPPGDYRMSAAEIVPVGDLRAYHMPFDQRLRLGSKGPGHDHWFRYDRIRLLRRKPSYEELADRVAELLRSQAVPWWNGSIGELEG